MEKPAMAGFCLGGDMGTRTPDLFDANEALSQLSYIPKNNAEYTAAALRVSTQRRCCRAMI